jgi:hypothetical protein
MVLLRRNTSSLFNSQKCEKKKHWGGGPSKKRMEYKVLFIAACHHIIAPTEVLCRHVLQNNTFIQSQARRMERTIISYTPSPLCILALYKQPHIKKWVHVVFSQGVDQSEHEAGKTSSVVLRMSEISVNILTAKYLNGWGCGCPSIRDARAWASSEKFKCRHSP